MEANQHARVCVYSSELQTALKALFFYICRVRWLKQMSQEINENAKIAEQCPPRLESNLDIQTGRWDKSS